jgi:hypothetical protein
VATLLQFSRNIRKLGSRIENNSVALTKRVVKRALVALVEGTPVDEGDARSNWRVSLGNPTRSVIPAYSPGKKLGIGERQNARATIQAGIATINQLRVGAKRGSGQAGTALFITNAIPYLGRLRDGSSSQQPNDWVEIALLDAQAEIAQVRLLDRTVSAE